MYVILGIITVKPEHLTEFTEHVRRHPEHSVREAGCLRFDVLQDHGDPYTICLYEVFRTEADLDIHHEQPYYEQWMEMSREWRDGSRYSRRVLQNLFPADDDWTDVRS